MTLPLAGIETIGAGKGRAHRMSKGVYRRQITHRTAPRRCIAFSPFYLLLVILAPFILLLVLLLLLPLILLLILTTLV